MSNAVTKTAQEYINAFGEVFTAGIESIVKAAKIYVDAIEANPANADKFKDHFRDTIPPGAWSGFEAVGRKWMHPKLLLGGGGQYAHKIKRLPYSQQERVFEGGRFELLTNGGETLHVDMREVTKDQVDQLLDGNHVRNLAEQKAYVESRAVEPQQEAVLPYSIHDGKVTIRRGLTLTRDEVRRIWREMKSE